MRTDHVFYKLLQAFPETLFALAGVPPPAPGGYRFESVEVKATALRIDGVLVPNVPTQPYYFAEVQFQKDKEIYWRLFTELLLYMRRSAPEGDWRAVLIFPNRTLDVQVPAALRALALDERFVQVYLDEIAVEEDSPLGLSLVRLVVEQVSTFPARARRLLERTREQLPQGEAQRRVLELIESIIVYKLRYGPEEIEAMFTLDELENTPYVQGKMAQARREAEREAKREAKREMLLQLLQEKFAPLPDELVQRVAAIPDEQQLVQLSIALLNAPDLESFGTQL
ncbi:Rpn family recombination-promoting nuclease/putative transposase [Gloeobacter morelensis]|uniref:Rpn family recombination-promoting nuclease/putative transposase n=1 Tax=Gloeobacter morelensis MG652769 TaxID=2781736 RepID=A0ABY3PJW9_9CYAN|nr:Rpn family recombination-promoting nuclease/putative transposase [Gloeobacter morelensis]UFP93843.1 Rpn family recombination-promoting nuclease/putative transposase [Gloeobacter morelensis MG652769]